MATGKKREPDAMDEFAAAVAHEIRNPLSSIKMNLQVFSRGLNSLSSGEPVSIPGLREHCKVALKAVEHLERIVQDIFYFSRPKTALKLSEEDVPEVIELSLLMAEKEIEEKEIKVVKEIKSLPPIRMDAARVKQAFLNIFLNGIHAMDKGGRLTIRAGYEDVYVSIDITDTGKGMTPEVLERVFEPFFTTDPQGTGLGMTLTKRLIEEHNGTVEIRSEPGKGTTVTVKLPADAVNT